MALQVVAQIADVPMGSAKVLKVADREIALFNVEGTFYACDNRCIHRGGPLAEGPLQGTIVTCPWHMWQYDLTTGACEDAGGRTTATYEVVVRGSEILLDPAVIKNAA